MTQHLGKVIIGAYLMPIITYAAGYLAAVHTNTFESVLDRGLPLAAKVPCRVPVSYTHLDVYKRQSVCCLATMQSESNTCLLYTSRCV